MRETSKMTKIWTRDNWPSDRWPSFSFDEMACRETGGNLMIPAFMDRLQNLRDHLGFPLIVTSGYRSLEHSVEAIKPHDRPGSHTYGLAVDISISGDRAWSLLHEATNLDFTGIGIKQAGPVKGRFIHLDTLTPDIARHAPRPAVWSY
jgi:zinc D-Ala-D-Ala carboxypeptidase